MRNFFTTCNETERMQNTSCFARRVHEPSWVSARQAWAATNGTVRKMATEQDLTQRRRERRV